MNTKITTLPWVLKTELIQNNKPVKWILGPVQAVAGIEQPAQLVVAIIKDSAEHAEFIHRAVNSYDALVADKAVLVTTLTNMKKYLTNCGFVEDHPWRVEIDAALAAVGAA